MYLCIYVYEAKGPVHLAGVPRPSLRSRLPRVTRRSEHVQKMCHVLVYSEHAQKMVYRKCYGARVTACLCGEDAPRCDGDELELKLNPCPCSSLISSRQHALSA